MDDSIFRTSWSSNLTMCGLLHVDYSLIFEEPEENKISSL